MVSQYRSGMLAAVNEQRSRLVLFVLGISQLGLGSFLAVAPGTFFNAIADYGERNDHLLRDISTLYLALGIVLIAAVRRPAWRVPVLAFGVFQYGLHSLNHLIDVGEADPGWLGPFNLVSLALFTLLFAYALRESGKRLT
jgi:hypothetical protein